MKAHNTLFVAVLALVVPRMSLDATAEEKPPTIVIQAPNHAEPTPMSWSHWGIYVRVKHIPARATVRIRYANEIHTHVYDTTYPWTQPPTSPDKPVRFYDRFFRAEPGKHPVTAELLVGDSAEPVATATGTAWFKKRSDEELQKRLVGQSKFVASETGSLEYGRESWRDDVFKLLRGRQEGNPPDERDFLTNNLHLFQDRPHKYLFARVKAYHRAAASYGAAFRPGDQLRALKIAHEIWLAENNRVIRGPLLKKRPIIYQSTYDKYAPRHFHSLALFYAQRRDRDKAIKWMTESAKFSFEQARRATHLSQRKRNKCLESGAKDYRWIARMHMIVFGDIEAYEAWMKKYLEALPKKERDESSGVNLMDVQAE